MKGWLDKYVEGGELDKNALSGVKNVLSAVGDVTSAPARGLTYLATGKYQDPSEAMGITNPYGAFATDLVLDPMNLVGAGLLKLASGPSKLSKVTKAASKLSKAADVTSAIKNYKSPDIKLDPNKFPGPKNIPINPKQFNQAVKSTLSALTERGQKLDQVTGGKFNVTPDDIHYHGTFAARPIVEVKTPHGSEYFYKSTGWGGKKEVDPGQWQVFGQWMDAPAGTVKPNSVNDWFVKGKGFDQFYGSQSFGNVANSLDNALIKKYNVPPEDLNKFLNFQNMQSDANTFIPKRNNGGWLDKYNDGGPVQENYNDYSVSAGEGFQGDGYSNVGRNYSPAWGGQFQMGGVVNRFMQPTETFKNYGYNPIEKGMSTEYSTSIGGPGEVYLVPGYRQGRLLDDPEATFNMYGEHLGGPFKTVQAAEDFAQLRHKYVEQNKNLPAPFKTRDYAMGGSIGGATQGIPGATGFMYSRNSGSNPSEDEGRNKVYKTDASAQNGKEIKKNEEDKTYYSGTLPEITVVGSKDPQTEKFYRNMFDRLSIEEGVEQGLLPYDSSEYDMMFSDPFSTNNILGRYEGLMDLGKKYGFPKVHPKDPNSIFAIAEKLTDGAHSTAPANYNPLTKTIQARTSKEWVSEMAHHLQFKNNPISTAFKFLGNDVPAYVSENSPYEKPGSMEYEAHSIIEPKLLEEMKKSRSDYKKLPYIQKKIDEDYGPIYQNGGEMKYYQNGLDFKPKSISKNGSKVIKDDRGQWAHPGEITEIGSNQITMRGVPYPVMGISDTGDMQMMYPDEDYVYDGESVTEIPMMAQGGQLTKLDQLTNFTNYNTKQPGGWLDKYQ